MKKIYYWGPFIDNKIATVKAIYNSVDGINQFSDKYEARIVDSLGEWNFKINENNKKYFISTNKDIFKILPKYGFLKSRISYFIIFLFSFFSIKKVLKKNRPEYFLAHLILPLPLILFKFFNFETKLIIRISGKPKLNFFRKFLWKNTSDIVYKVFCPTEDTKKTLIEQKIFKPEKIFVLHDPVFSINEFINLKRDQILDKKFEKNNIILAGRLTNQKNFDLMIEAYKQNKNLSKKFKVFIFGDGELKDRLKKKIKDYNLEDRIIFLGHKNNIYKYMANSKLFILTSLWEDPGFVLVEAALNNVTILSSNCPSGPEEIIDKNEYGGYLFTSNDPESLNKKINFFIEDNEKNIFKKKKYVKKNIKKFSIFNHSLTLQRYLD
ncbi:glycosyltransferase [Candidatus Pelagibacter sp.]|nr:glycosyltransferase [Candidatus Pelagibacter sp.]